VLADKLILNIVRNAITYERLNGIWSLDFLLYIIISRCVYSTVETISLSTICSREKHVVMFVRI
jgi:hypothetical protein